MISHYLKGYNKRYSITSGGDVISHYRKTNSGGRFYQYKILKKKFNNHRSVSAGVNLTIKSGTVAISVSLMTLMAKYFNLVPPDEHHKYCLRSKDGDPFKTRLSNLHWVIFTNKDYAFQPKCFHRKGKIVSKICGECGEKKPIVNFRFSCNPNWKGARVNKKTRRNQCEQCRSSHQWEAIKSDPERLERFLKNSNKWRKSKKGRAYHLKYGIESRVRLDDWYINQLIRRVKQNPEHYTKEMKEIVKISAQIRREIKKQS